MVKNHAFVILWYGCNPRNVWFCTWCGTSVWKLYCKAIFCYRSVIYKRSQITICSNVWATFQSTHDCRYGIEWLFKNDIHCLRTVCCNFYSSSCTRLCLAILFFFHDCIFYVFTIDNDNRIYKRWKIWKLYILYRAIIVTLYSNITCF